MAVDRVESAIPGFDTVVEGGFVSNSLNLVAGGPGAGKTIFCMQFIINGIEKFDEPGLIISFDESMDGIVEDARAFGWDFVELEKKGKCALIACEPFAETNLKEKVEAAIKKHNVKRVIIDSMSVFAAGLSNDPYRLRKELYRLSSFLEELDCTVLVTAEVNGEAPLDMSSAGGSLTKDGLIEFVADSVITLHNSGLGGEADRAVRVVKMRRTNHRRDPVPMKITDHGIEVMGESI